jgi:hypothetical protein
VLPPQTQTNGGSHLKDDDSHGEAEACIETSATPQSDTSRPRRRNINPGLHTPDKEETQVEEQSPASHHLSKELIEMLTNHATSVFIYICEVVAVAFHLLRTPFSVMLCLCIFTLGVTYTAQHTPICLIPFVSRSALCKRTLPRAEKPIFRADFPNLLRIQQKTVDDLVGETTSGSALAFQVTKAEMATGDLITLVSVSDLPSRDLLVDRLSQFIRDASATAEGLHDLNAKVIGAVDT